MGSPSRHLQFSCMGLFETQHHVDCLKIVDPNIQCFCFGVYFIFRDTHLTQMKYHQLLIQPHLSKHHINISPSFHPWNSPHQISCSMFTMKYPHLWWNPHGCYLGHGLTWWPLRRSSCNPWASWVESIVPDPEGFWSVDEGQNVQIQLDSTSVTT